MKILKDTASSAQQEIIMGREELVQVYSQRPILECNILAKLRELRPMTNENEPLWWYWEHQVCVGSTQKWQWHHFQHPPSSSIVHLHTCGRFGGSFTGFISHFTNPHNFSGSNSSITLRSHLSGTNRGKILQTEEGQISHSIDNDAAQN